MGPILKEFASFTGELLSLSRFGLAVPHIVFSFHY
jgi:hypothetical protein